MVRIKNLKNIYQKYPNSEHYSVEEIQLGNSRLKNLSYLQDLRDVESKSQLFVVLDLKTSTEGEVCLIDGQ